MRALIMNDEVKQKIKTQVEWAERPENWYHPERDQEPPGDNPAYVLMLEMGFRVVYTHTAMQGRNYRHLSVSVEGTKYPNEIAAYTLATLFGFTGGHQVQDATAQAGKDWQMNVDNETRCIVFAQEIEQ